MKRAVPLMLLVLVSFTPGVASAQRSGDSQPFRFLRWPVQDARAMVSGVTSPRMLYVIGAGGILLAAASLDEPLTERAAEIADTPTLRVVEEFGNVRAVRPMMAVIVISAFMTDSDRYRDAAFTSLEAIVFANLITNTLKSLFGRARPWQGEGSSSFAPFSGNTSFPSGHSTTAFALVTPWFFYYPHYATGGLLLLGAATAFSRMATNVHWLTDVIAGSTIGFTTGYWLSRRHQKSSRSVSISPTLSANQIGVSVRF